MTLTRQRHLTSHISSAGLLFSWCIICPQLLRSSQHCVFWFCSLTIKCYLKYQRIRISVRSTNFTYKQHKTTFHVSQIKIIDRDHFNGVPLNKLNLQLTTTKGARPINQTSATDWQMVVQGNNLISITLRLIH